MTHAEHDRRVEALTQEFETLFSGDNIGLEIQPGWFSILQHACNEICAILDPADKPAVRFVQIKEKLGGLRIYANVSAPRLDVFSPTGVVSSYANLPLKARTASLSDRIAPIVREAEARSYRTCLFCGVSGHLRQDRDWILTLCDRHAHYDYRHLDLAFEQMTDPNRDPLPPTREQIIEAIRAEDRQLAALGISCVGLLPPRSAAGIWRLAVENGEDACEVLRTAQSAVAWPLDLARAPSGSGDHLSFRDIIWMRGDL